ncbi:ribonuclease P protein component [Candidatus Babeliales bacterium]|nr:ribonuclease P protein component [Candidatus Babeliales bacterium]
MHNKISNKLSKFSKKELDHFFDVAKSPKKNQAFTFLTAKATLPFGRILIVASRKYGNAPQRNLLKRRAKAIFWENKLYEKKIDLAIIARPSGKSYDFDQLKKLVLEIFTQY